MLFINYVIHGLSLLLGSIQKFNETIQNSQKFQRIRIHFYKANTNQALSEPPLSKLLDKELGSDHIPHRGKHIIRPNAYKEAPVSRQRCPTTGLGNTAIPIPVSFAFEKLLSLLACAVIALFGTSYHILPFSRNKTMRSYHGNPNCQHCNCFLGYYQFLIAQKNHSKPIQLYNGMLVHHVHFCHHHTSLWYFRRGKKHYQSFTGTTMLQFNEQLKLARAARGLPGDPGRRKSIFSLTNTTIPLTVRQVVTNPAVRRGAISTKTFDPVPPWIVVAHNTTPSAGHPGSNTVNGLNTFDGLVPPCQFIDAPC